LKLKPFIFWEATMPRVIHFEIQADDPERAVNFFKNVFGWKIDKWGPEEYWLATTGDDKEMGINGAIMRRNPMTNPTTNTIGVSSVDDYTAKINANGGKVVMPKSVIPGIGYFAYCQDTEGNTFGILQPDSAAK
jgi:predicted enzyme related to lactoylglutathione lyase